MILFPMILLFIAMPIITILTYYFIIKYGIKHGMQERDEEQRQLNAKVPTKIKNIKDSLQTETKEIHKEKLQMKNMQKGSLSSIFKSEEKSI